MVGIRKLFVALVMIAVSLWGFSVEAVASAPTGKRVALVVGNSAYLHAVTLPNPVKDAHLMSATLKGAGFEVIEGFDVDKAALETLVDKFTESAYGADLGLIYYAGHGLQVDGKNYIIPVDAELTSPAHLKTRAVEVDGLLATLPQDPAVGIVILDACRDNPLARTLAASLPKSRSANIGSNGFAVMQPTQASSTGGVLIAYATDPGAVALDGDGANSPYTAALARHIATPGLEIQGALTRVKSDVATATEGRQRPWHNSSLGREVYIGAPPEPPESSVAVGRSDVAPTLVPEVNAQQMLWEEEQRFFDEAVKRDTAPYYELYLKRYPDGRFVDIARLNMDNAKLKSTQEVAKADITTAPQVVPGSQVRTGVSLQQDVRDEQGTAVTEAALGLNKQARIDLQLRFTALGFKLGIDGGLGKQSREAIGEWQRRNGLPNTTYLTQNQYAHLIAQTESMMPAVRAEYEGKKQAITRQKERKVIRRNSNGDELVGRVGGGRRGDQQDATGDALKTILGTAGFVCAVSRRC
ncbi:caspase family protein [Rhizobium brockwellii]|uniref:caspase family protein n=1 Tax=Rhizobium brockwellii TaxID=3019932 RepID=UPI003F9B283A